MKNESKEFLKSKERALKIFNDLCWAGGYANGFIAGKKAAERAAKRKISKVDKTYETTDDRCQ
jgi:hypothetical protein